jgi:hypothetical protein
LPAVRTGETIPTVDADHLYAPAVKCRVHYTEDALGVCHFCKNAICFDCAARTGPHLICVPCARKGYAIGFEYRSALAIGDWPLLHICSAIDAATMRPRPARGVIAIGPLAIGGIALGGCACGLVALGGLSLGLVAAVGGAAIGFGLSIGDLAVGAVAIGGCAAGLVHAIGGVAFAPSVISETRCDPQTRDLLLCWLGANWLPPQCGPR